MRWNIFELRQLFCLFVKLYFTMHTAWQSTSSQKGMFKFHSIIVVIHSRIYNSPFLIIATCLNFYERTFITIFSYTWRKDYCGFTIIFRFNADSISIESARKLEWAYCACIINRIKKIDVCKRWWAERQWWTIIELLSLLTFCQDDLLFGITDHC